MPVQTGEILFVKCVKCGIPNRDPLRDSDARRLFGEDDGRISLTDVSIKRDVRDYVLARYPGGGDDGTHFVFVRKEYSEDNKTLLGRDGLAQAILERRRTARPETPPTEASSAGGARRGGRAKAAGGGGDERALMMAGAFDVRVFGAVFSVAGKSFNQTGPVQFGWAHSLHPVETKYTQGTVCMPSKDAPVPTDTPSEKGKEEKGKTQGTIWTQYQLPFAVFAMPGVVNASIARDTGMTDSDMDLLLAGLWKGTLHRQARGRGIQQPLLLLHVEYKDPFFRIGFLEEGLRLETKPDPANRTGNERWRGGQPPTDLADVSLNVAGVGAQLAAHRERIARMRVWVDPQLRLTGELGAVPGSWPEEV
jgi:CRISPR-associated protein Csh2